MLRIGLRRTFTVTCENGIYSHNWAADDNIRIVEMGVFLFHPDHGAVGERRPGISQEFIFLSYRGKVDNELGAKDLLATCRRPLWAGGGEIAAAQKIDLTMAVLQLNHIAGPEIYSRGG